MADVVAEKLAEAKKKMFGNLQPAGGKIVLLVKGDARVECKDTKVEVRKI